MRADQKKNVDKVAASLAKNPLQTQKEIADKTGLGEGTVNRAMDKVEEYGVKDHRIISMTDKDFELQKMIQDRKLLKMRVAPSSISDSDLNQWDRHSMARFTLFRGDATDEQGGLREVSKEEKRKVADVLEIHDLI